VNFNKVILSGYLARDPEIRYTGSSIAICSFTVVTNHSRKKGDEWVQEPEFTPCEAWNDTAERIAEYLTKGALVIVEGRLKTESWDGECGKRHFRTKVVISSVRFGPRKERVPGEDEEKPAHQEQPPVVDDVPF